MVMWAGSSPHAQKKQIVNGLCGQKWATSGLRLERIERIWGSNDRCIAATKASAPYHRAKRRTSLKRRADVARIRGGGTPRLRGHFCEVRSRRSRRQKSPSWRNPEGHSVKMRQGRQSYGGFRMSVSRVGVSLSWRPGARASTCAGWPGVLSKRGKPRGSSLVLFLWQWECAKRTEPIRRKVGRGNAALFPCAPPRAAVRSTPPRSVSVQRPPFREAEAAAIC